MAESKEVKSKRDLTLERMRGKYPEQQFDDDEALFGQINDDYADYDNRIKGFEEREKSFSDLFTSDPRSAKFLTDWRQGKDPAVALVEMFGDDFVEELKDPVKQEEIAAANKAYAERIAKEKEYDEQYNQNILETRDTVAKMQQEEGLTDEDIDKAMEFLVGIMKDGLLGKFTPESIHMALNAINHDVDVENAGEEGELRGRNTKIEEKLRKGRRGDGTANLDGKNGGSSSPRQAPELGALNAFDSTNIWERGGERRKSYSK